ncbi:MAG: RDD family protein [Planctomycetota bacterium]
MSKRSLAWRRLAAFGIDWCLIAVWGTALFGVVLLFARGDLPRPSGPWVGQGIGFVAMTVPVLLYGALMESSTWRGTIGKRCMSLQVVGADGGQVSRGRAALRNVVKFTPWECGHTVAHQAVFAGEHMPPLWVSLLAIAACLMPIWWIGTIVVRGAAPYDLWSATNVEMK